MTIATAKPAPRYSYGPEVIDWIETHCVIPEGAKIGQPVVLMGWQREFIEELYRTDSDGELRYRWSLLGIPKGNGKSPLAAWLGLYHLLGDPDEEDPWVVVAAAADKQADIVFGLAKKTCEMSPTLRDKTERYRWEIRPKGAPGKMERVAASSGRLDGKNPSMLLLDELHEWSGETWDILTNGTVKRARAQIIQITTAGFDQESICFREYAKGRRIESGEVEMDDYLFRWYGAPEGSDYTDAKVWEAANPSFGQLVTERTLRDQWSKKTESVFRRYFLNQWVEAEEEWLPHGAWERCKAEPFEFEKGTKVALGWDASTKNDSTGIVTAAPRHCSADKLHIRLKARVWERPYGPDGQPDDTWRLPIVECEGHVRAQCEQFNVIGVAYDPAFITWSADELEAAGLPMEEFPQSPARMAPATAAASELILDVCECGDPRLEHDGDPVLARHIRAAVPRSMRRGGQMLEKSATRRKIDAAVAMLMAIGVVLKYEDETPAPAGVFFV